MLLMRIPWEGNMYDDTGLILGMNVKSSLLEHMIHFILSLLKIPVFLLCFPKLSGHIPLIMGFGVSQEIDCR